MRNVDAVPPGGTEIDRPGWWCRASYRQPLDDVERGNPLLLALPPPKSFDEWAEILTVKLPNVEQDRSSLPPWVRSEQTLLIKNFMEPTERNILIGVQILSSIRASYVGRNAAGPSYADWLRGGALERTGTTCGSPEQCVSGVGGMVRGPPGVGKSHGIRCALAEVPQVVEHSYFEGRPLSLLQLPYLMTDTAAGGSLGILGYAAVRKVDRILRTNYLDIEAAKLRNGESSLEVLRQIGERQFLGTWIIDEAQNLKLADSRARAKVVSSWKRILNETGMSLIIAGTGSTAELVADVLHGSRRVVGVGDIKFPRFLPDKTWKRFTQVLFKHQYVKEPVEWSEGWATHLFALTLGVTDLAVKLFVMAQRRAILERRETLSFKLMREEFDRSFSPVFKSLNAIERNLRGPNPDPLSEPDEADFRALLNEIDPQSVPAPSSSADSSPSRKRKARPGADAPTEDVMAKVREALDRKNEPSIADIVAAGSEAGKDAHEALKDAGMAA